MKEEVVKKPVKKLGTDEAYSHKQFIPRTKKKQQRTAFLEMISRIKDRSPEREKRPKAKKYKKRSRG